MDKIISRMERLEVQCEVLCEENNANKITIKMLKKTLLDSERKIQELTDIIAQTSPVQNADDVKIDKRFRVLEEKMIKLEHRQRQQIQDVNKKFGKVDKIQKVFNAAILKRATANDKIERLSFRMDFVCDVMGDLQANAVISSSQMHELDSKCTSTHKEVKDLELSRTQTEETKQAQAGSAATPLTGQGEDLEIEKKFKSCMTRVSDRNVPLSEDVYKQLPALESIAGIPDGPAFQFLNNCQRGNSQEAESIRQRHLKKFHTKGINTKLMAMTEYVKLCDQHTCDNHMDDTQYHPVSHGFFFGRHHILAIDSGCLRFLDPPFKTKKESKSWPWKKVAKCELDLYGGVELTFTDGDKTWFYTYENINPLVHATICSFLKK